MTRTNTYRIISTLDGSTETCSLSELSQKLKLNCILAELNSDGSLIDSWPLVHETLVTFAVEFADYTLLNYTKKKKIPEAEACIALTRKWLENSETVSKEELRVAANAAARAAANAAYAAYAAAAAHAAYDAARATYAAANAAAAAYAAANAAGGGEKKREAELIRQGQFIVGYLKSSSSK